MTIDPDRVAALIREVSATIIMPRFKLPQSHEIIEKAPGELATIADREAETQLMAAFTSMDPGSEAIGEEAVSAVPDLMARVGAADNLWLIDPIDGTNNFIKGSDNFAVMVARLHKGHATHAWIYQPVTDVMAVTEVGAGCWLNGQRFHVPGPPALKAMTGAAHIGRFPPDVRARLEAGLKAVGQNRPLYCAGLDYLALIRGQKHFSLYSRTLPWDHAPGTLLFKESGGYVARLDGRDYEPAGAAPGLLSAPNVECWHQLHDLLIGN